MRLEFLPTFSRTGESASIPAAPATGSVSRPATSRWLAFLIGLSVAVATLTVWQALRVQERARIASTAALQLESVKNEITVRMESRLLALARMARRWELRERSQRAEWESDAALYMRHYAGYAAIALVDPSLQVRWQVQRDAGRAPNLTTLFAEGSAPLQAAHDQSPITLTPPIKLSAGERVFVASIPLSTRQGFAGWVVGVFQVQTLLDDILREHIAPGYGVSIAAGGDLIYLRGPLLKSGLEPWSQESDIVLENLRWQARVWPLPPVLAAAGSPLPGAVLIGGLGLALLLALSVHFAQVARARTKETEDVNRELKRQMAERREAQERLRKLSRAVDQSPSMVLICDTRGAIEYVNPKFTQVTGYALAEMLGENPRILKSGETPPEVYRHLWATITAGGEWRGELHNKKKTGELYWEHVAISPVRDENGAITHFLAEMEDITERKRLEREVSDRNREIAETQALAVMGQAASMIAHDLRNPLSTIKMGLQILGRFSGKAHTNTEHELSRIALEQVRYMEDVLADLLTYSRPGKLELEWLNIDKLLDTSILLAQREIEEHRVRVETRYQPGLPTLHGDANKLRQAFSNLILNATQATEGITATTPRIEICTSLQLLRDPTEIRVEISDNGAGIPPENRDHVFEPFFTTRAKGTGLGLPIAKRIIDQHHGRLDLQATPDGGTRVIVTLAIGPVTP